MMESGDLLLIWNKTCLTTYADPTLEIVYY
jgi:hypothetical protein